VHSGRDNPYYTPEIGLDNVLDTYDHWNIDKEKKALEEELRVIGEKIRVQLGIDSFDKFGEPTPGESTIVGRIRMIEGDSSDAFELINTLDDTSPSTVVSVSLKNPDQVHFFSGQIVALRGVAESSTKFEADKIITHTFETPSNPLPSGEGHLSIVYS
jgi:hypothetical protein